MGIAEPAEIIPRLHLSSFPDPISPKYTHVLNICTTPNPPDSHKPETVILNIQILDLDDITPHIPQITAFLNSALEAPGNQVLVHCALGINRSASAVVAYLCHRNQIDSSEALSYLKSKKSDVRPSVVFLRQIDRHFGYEQMKEDPLVAFHERLRRRKAGVPIGDSGK